MRNSCLLNKVFFIFLCAVLLSSCDFTPSGTYFTEADIHAEKGDYKMALYYIEKSLKQRPNYRRAIYNRAIYKEKLGDFEGAIVDYLEILKQDPRNTDVLSRIAFGFQEKNNHKLALDYFNRALKSDLVVLPDTSSGAFRINENFWNDEEDPDSDYEMNIENILYWRGMSHLALQQWDSAQTDFQKILSYYPEFEEPLLGVGKALLGKNDSLNACEYLKKAVLSGSEEAKVLLTQNCN